MQGLPRRPQGPHVARSARFLFFISSLAKPIGGRWLLVKIGFLLRRSYPGAVGREARRLSRMTCPARTRQCANARAAEGICNPELVEHPVRRFRPLSTLRALRKFYIVAVSISVPETCASKLARRKFDVARSARRQCLKPFVRRPCSPFHRYPPPSPAPPLNSSSECPSVTCSSAP